VKPTTKSRLSFWAFVGALVFAFLTVVVSINGMGFPRLSRSRVQLKDHGVFGPFLSRSDSSVV